MKAVGVRVSVLRREIRAGFAEEVTFELGFEAQAGFHWLENQEGTVQSRESHKKQVAKSRNT